MTAAITSAGTEGSPDRRGQIGEHVIWDSFWRCLATNAATEVCLTGCLRSEAASTSLRSGQETPSIPEFFGTLNRNRES